MQKLSYVLCKNQTLAVEGVGGEGAGGEIVNRSHRDCEADELGHCDLTNEQLCREVLKAFTGENCFYAVDRENPYQNNEKAEGIGLLMYFVSEIGNTL